MHIKNSGKCRRRALKGGIALLGLFCSLHTPQGYAQIVSTHWFQGLDQLSNPHLVDANHYSMDVKPSDNSITVAAGTVYGPGNELGVRVHFVQFDNAGNIITSKSLFNSSHNPPYAQYGEFAIDIASANQGGTDGYFITSSLHWQPLPSYMTPSFFNLKLTKVDDGGVPSISRTYLRINNNGQSSHVLYPVHSIYDNNVVYICGYTAELPDPLPNKFFDKKAFVMAINANPASATYMGVLAAKTYDYPTLPTGGQFEDHDVAMRMKKLSDGSIAVTGSVNAQVGLASPWQATTISCATMNLNLDPVTLNVNEDHPFALPGIDGMPIAMQYGIDIIEDQNNDRYYIVGNRYHSENPDPNVKEMTDVLPNDIFITEINSPSNPPAYDYIPARHCMYGAGWALQNVPVDQGPAETQMLLYGMALSATNSVNNVRAGLHSLAVDFSTPPYISVNSGRFYETSTGTGTVPADVNNYWRLGHALNNPAWGPTSAVLHDGMSSGPLGNVAITAPRWDTRMHLKWISDIKSVDDPIPSPNDCGIKPSAPTIYDETVGPTYLSVVAEDMIVRVFDLFPTVEDFEYWDAFCSVDPTDYKPAGIKDLKLYGNSIYPNPASGELYIGLDKSIAATAAVEVYLVSMQGQMIGNLYKGSAAGLHTNSRVALPPVATGLYMVQIVADGNILMQQKLSIR